MRYRYRCPYCGRAYKTAAGVQRHRNKGTRPGWCTALGTAAARDAHELHPRERLWGRP